MGESPHPPRAPYNSAFVRCFTVSLFPVLTNLREGQLCLGREEKKTKGASQGPPADPPYPGGGGVVL